MTRDGSKPRGWLIAAAFLLILVIGFATTTLYAIFGRYWWIGFIAVAAIITIFVRLLLWARDDERAPEPEDP